METADLWLLGTGGERSGGGGGGVGVAADSAGFLRGDGLELDISDGYTTLRQLTPTEFYTSKG